MIKVQPAHSKVLKDESPDHLTLTLPPRGFRNWGGVLLGLAVLWTGGAIAGAAWALRAGVPEWEIAALVGLVPGPLLGFTVIATGRGSWTLERTGDALLFIRRRPWGTSVRSWPAGDITSLWVQESTVAGEVRSVLTVGFRNGRSEEILSIGSPEELRWLAAVLSDPRGSRRSPELPVQVAEPLRKKSDPDAVPSSLSIRRDPTGVDLEFHPLLRSQRRWKQILAISCLGVGGILGTACLAGVLLRDWSPAAFAPLALLAFLGVMAVWIIRLSRSATVRVRDGGVTVAQQPFGGAFQFPVSEVEFVQTLGAGHETELQFLIRGRPKIRLFRGRPADELEWAARFLRVAIKGRPVEETRPMQVDAAAGACQVCGEKMERRVIYCAKCRTPHHEECWSYVGQCSTYGCRGIGFTRT